MKWTEVVSNPYGLTAFALALVFGVAGKLAARNRKWFLPVAITLAALVIVGGLFLAYQDVQSRSKSASTASPQEKPREVKQETHGPNSPAVQGVGGDVIIDQSKGRTGE
jgi:hypothetical protein